MRPPNFLTQKNANEHNLYRENLEYQENDLSNLRRKKPGTNRSHDYEAGRVSEAEDYDADGEMDYFIEDV